MNRAITAPGPDRRKALSRPFLGSARPYSIPNRVYAWLRQGVNRRLYRFLAARALCGEGRRVLEAGAGSAHAASLFARDSRVDLCVALDLDEQVLRAARERDPSLRVVVGDLNHLPFTDDAFDLVFNSSTVEHLAAPERGVREMARLCKCGGQVFVGVPQRLGPLGFQPLVRNTSAGIWIGPVFSRSELDALLRRAGVAAHHHLSYFFRFFIGAGGSPEK
jgi:ubiquinone/menaquinone biosynthesis C-methylase UbiE